MTAPIKTTEPEEPELFRYRRPSPAARAYLGLATVEAAHVAGIVPDGLAAGAAIALAAAGYFVKGCVYRGR